MDSSILVYTNHPDLVTLVTVVFADDHHWSYVSVAVPETAHRTG